MVRKTKEDTQITRDRILNAAADLFYEKGVSHTTLGDIAKAVGMTRGAIYWHFTNKLDLFSALHERMHHGLMEQLAERQVLSSPQPLQDLAEFSIKMLQDVETNPDLRKAMSIFALQCDYTGDMAPFLEEQNEQKVAALENITTFFQRADALGQLKPGSDCPTLALALFCFMCGIVTEHMTSPKLINLHLLSRPLIETFFKSIQA